LQGRHVVLTWLRQLTGLLIDKFFVILLHWGLELHGRFEVRCHTIGVRRLAILTFLRAIHINKRKLYHASLFLGDGSRLSRFAMRILVDELEFSADF
jgi:hypothetical protein